MGRTFIESENFPISVVNNASAKEKGGGGRPPYWEMVFWWTRKPLAGARAVIAASLLPEEASVREFLKRIYPSYSPPGNSFTKTPHRDNPLLPSEWKKTFEAFEQAGSPVPPVMIVVCDNTSLAKLVHEHIAKGNVMDPDTPLEEIPLIKYGQRIIERLSQAIEPGL